MGGGATVVRSSGEPWPEESEETWRLWSEGPDMLRVEFALGDETVTAWFQGHQMVELVWRASRSWPARPSGYGHTPSPEVTST